METELQVRAYQSSDETALIGLWESCELVVPWNDPRRDIALKLSVQPELLLVGTLEDRLVASVMVGYDGHRGWINYLGVSPEFRGRSFGRTMMAAAERRLRALGCPKINLQVRSTNGAALGFYRKLGYAQDDVVSLGKRF